MLKHSFGAACAAFLAAAALALLTSVPARATETATPAAPAAPPTASAAPSTTAAVPAAAVAEPRTFKVPAGWRKQKRNGDVAYCRKIVALGSRFEKLQCMTEAELEQYIAMNQENRDTMQQRIAVCGTGSICSNP